MIFAIVPSSPKRKFRNNCGACFVEFPVTGTRMDVRAFGPRAGRLRQCFTFFGCVPGTGFGVLASGLHRLTELILFDYIILEQILL